MREVIEPTRTLDNEKILFFSFSCQTFIFPFFSALKAHFDATSVCVGTARRRGEQTLCSARHPSGRRARTATDNKTVETRGGRRGGGEDAAVEEKEGIQRGR